MRERISKSSGHAALAISLISLIVASSGIADAARQAITHAIGGSLQGVHGVGAHRVHRRAAATMLAGHKLSTRPYPDGLLLLGRNRKFSASAIPTVKNAHELGGRKLEEIEPTCPGDTVDLGTWCLETSPYPLTNQDVGHNNYFWATQTCVAAGGYLPTAAQLIGAAKRVKLESTIHDNRDTSTIAEDPSIGLKDQREMSATLVTTAGGSEAAGSEGVSVGATGNPRTGEPNPQPLPANPSPATLQYVTVYSNGTNGGFAGSQPVSEPQNFRCAYNKVPGASATEEG